VQERRMPCISSIHSDMQRQMNPESRTMLPKMAFTGFASRYREPTVDEGFDDITKVNFKVRFGTRWDPIQSNTPSFHLHLHLQ
jgi:hypothetical protein